MDLAELRRIAFKLKREQFLEQVGPFLLLQAPEKESAAQGSELGRTQFLSRVAIAVGFDLLHESFDDLEVGFLPPLRDEDRLRVGRLPDNDVVCGHPSVSKSHAALIWDEKKKRCTVKDLGSSNGTAVNGQAVDSRKLEEQLKDGDVVSFGGARYLFYTAAALFDLLNSAEK